MASKCHEVVHDTLGYLLTGVSGTISRHTMQKPMPSKRHEVVHDTLGNSGMAVPWNGPRHPRLTQTWGVGNHFPTHDAEAHTPTIGDPI